MRTKLDANAHSVDGRWVDRDINAARNILSWGKSPSLHRRHIETGCDPLELVTVH